MTFKSKAPRDKLCSLPFKWMSVNIYNFFALPILLGNPFKIDVSPSRPSKGILLIRSKKWQHGKWSANLNCNVLVQHLMSTFCLHMVGLSVAMGNLEIEELVPHLCIWLAFSLWIYLPNHIRFHIQHHGSGNMTLYLNVPESLASHVRVKMFLEVIAVFLLSLEK